MFTVLFVTAFQFLLVEVFLFSGLTLCRLSAFTMSDKSSSRKTSKESGRGRSPPSSSRQGKERSAKVKARTPTPHPAKRSSSQLFGPHPPPPPPAVPATSDQRSKLTVGQANPVAVADSPTACEDDLWDSQNSPRSPEVSPPRPGRGQISSSPGDPAVMSPPLPPAVLPAPGLPARSSQQPALTVGNSGSHFVAPLPPATYGFPPVAGPSTGLDSAPLRVPPPLPAVSAPSRPWVPPVMTPWMQGPAWNPYQWPTPFPTTPGFQPPPGFPPSWTMMSSYTCPPPPGFDGATSRRQAAQSSTARPEPDPRSTAPRRRTSSLSDDSGGSERPGPAALSGTGALGRPRSLYQARSPTGLSFPPQVDAMPEVGYSVPEGPLWKGINPTWSEAEDEVSDSYSTDAADDDMPLLSKSPTLPHHLDYFGHSREYESVDRPLDPDDRSGSAVARPTIRAV